MRNRVMLTGIAAILLAAGGVWGIGNGIHGRADAGAHGGADASAEASADSRDTPTYQDGDLDKIVRAVVRINEIAFTANAASAGNDPDRDALVNHPAFADLATRTAQMADELAANPDGALHVDRIQARLVEVHRDTADNQRIVMDIEITRHIVEDDVQWTEIIPHEVTFDAAGQPIAVIARDPADLTTGTDN